MSTELSTQPQRRQIIVQEAAVPLFDTGKFDHMGRIAKVMANMSLIPDHLRGNDADVTFANCFMVVNQAHIWGMDPFAVAQSMFVVHGKLGYEGKLIAAMIEAKTGYPLDYQWNDATPGTDAYGIRVTGVRPSDGEIKTIEGTVGGWKTFEKSGAVKGAWIGDQSTMQLAYRGARTWARLYAPALMLGVYTPEELEEMHGEFRARTARDVTTREEPAAPPEEGKRGRGRPRKDENRHQANANEAGTDAANDAGAGDGKQIEGEVAKSETAAPAAETKPETKSEPAAPAASEQKAEPAAPPATTKKAPPAVVVNNDAEKVWLDGLLERIGPDRELKDFILDVHGEFMKHNTTDGLRGAWETKAGGKKWTTTQREFLTEFRSHHRDRAVAAETGQPAPEPAAPPAAKEKPEFDYAGFLHHVEVELGKAKNADEVARFFAELTDEPLKDGLITEQQMEDDIRPLSLSALEKFDFTK